VVLTAGCDGGGSGGAVPLDQVGTQYAAAFCRKAFTCCDATELASDGATAVDEATCRATVAVGVSANVANNMDDMAAGRVVYHGDSARRCLDVVAGLACEQWGADEALARFPDCLKVFEGKVAPGAPCTRDAQCADGFCDVNGTGVCVARPKSGEACTSGLCSQGLVCLSDSVGSFTVCGAALADGSPCRFDAECASASCNIDAATNTASCGPMTFCNGV
jgi:hypothetical protein